MKLRLLLANFLFYLHIFITLSFPLFFFIPSKVWPQRIGIHFWWMVFVFSMFYIWGAIYTFKFRNKVYAVCILTTLTQVLRGNSFWHLDNYDHSFVEEATSRFLSFKFKGKYVPLALFSCISIGLILYILKVYGIILY